MFRPEIIEYVKREHFSLPTRGKILRVNGNANYFTCVVHQQASSL